MTNLTHPNLLAAFIALRLAGWKQAERGFKYAENWINARIPIEILGDCRAVIRFVCSQNQLKAPWHDPEAIVRELLPQAYATMAVTPTNPPLPPPVAAGTPANTPASKPFPRPKK